MTDTPPPTCFNGATEAQHPPKVKVAGSNPAWNTGCSSCPPSSGSHSSWSVRLTVGCSPLKAVARVRFPYGLLGSSRGPVPSAGFDPAALAVRLRAPLPSCRWDHLGDGAPLVRAMRRVRILSPALREFVSADERPLLFEVRTSTRSF